MHLYTLTRGIKHCVDQYVNDCQAQFFKYGAGMLQLSMRPIQLWEIVFPQEHLKEVLGTVCNGDYNKKYEKLWKAMRLMLGAKKLPKFDYKKLPKRIIRKENVAVYPIGS